MSVRQSAYPVSQNISLIIECRKFRIAKVWKLAFKEFVDEEISFAILFTPLRLHVVCETPCGRKPETDR